MLTFNVTYEIVTPESAEHGDAEERGFILEGATFREAFCAAHETRTNRVDGIETIEADEWPIRAPRWFTVVNGTEFETGAHESRSLHLPDHVTTASRRRVARLFGLAC